MRSHLNNAGYEIHKSKKPQNGLGSDNRLLIRHLINILHRERQNHQIVVNELKQIIAEERKNCNEFLKEMHEILANISATDKNQTADCDEHSIEV